MIRRRVAVIVPVLDGAGVLPSCLDALLATNAEAFEIVVVDDGSRDRSVAVAREWAARSDGRLRVLVLDRNHGFAGAVNRGVASVLADGEPASILVFVNQDCVVAPGWLDPLVAALDDPGVAVAGARLLEADGVTLQHAGARIETSALTTHLGRGCRDGDAWRVSLDVDYVCGALMALRAATWRAFGPFDEGYAPAYYEEVDFCVRARRAALRVVYVPRSEARHLEAFSSGRASQTFLRRYHRSRLRFVVRCHAVDVGACRWLLAEMRWLLTLRRWSEVAPVLAAYARLPMLIGEVLRDRLEGPRRAANRAPASRTAAAGAAAARTPLRPQAPPLPQAPHR